MPSEPRAATRSDLVAAVCAAYGLAPPAHVADLGGGFTSNLRLAGERDLVLRIHPADTDADRLSALQQARQVAHAAGLPTAPPLHTLDGRTSHEHAGLVCELEPFLAWHDRMSTAERLITGFELLGRLHDVLHDADLPRAARTAPRANHLERGRDADVRAGLDRVRSWAQPKLSAYAAAAEAHLASVAEAESPGPLPRRLCHGDFWDNNVGLIDGEVTAVLDFDFLGDRERIDDLALPFFFWLLQPGRGLPTGKDRDLLRSLAAAYDRGADTPLTAEERHMLPVAVARQPAWSLGVWIQTLPEPGARSHARDAAAELPVAEAIMDQLTVWQDELARS